MNFFEYHPALAGELKAPPVSHVLGKQRFANLKNGSLGVSSTSTLSLPIVVPKDLVEN